jgi:hypothetical protein
MPQLTFTLKSPTLAIREVNRQRTLVTLPRNALVTLLGGDIDTKVFVRILYDDEALIMFAVDLRNRGLLVLKQSA